MLIGGRLPLLVNAYCFMIMLITIAEKSNLSDDHSSALATVALAVVHYTTHRGQKKAGVSLGVTFRRKMTHNQ